MAATVAVLSDVHGVLPVLEAVLAEPDVASADLVVVTGDHAAGPMPAETLDLLTSMGERCVLVRGNADRELVGITRGEPCEHPESVWAASQLRADQVLQELVDLRGRRAAGGLERRRVEVEEGQRLPDQHLAHAHLAPRQTVVLARVNPSAV